MSALGQKRTFAVQKGMPALPPKADMCSALGYVRFVPIADIAPAGCCSERVRPIYARTRVAVGPEAFLRLGPASASPNNGMNCADQLHMRERIMKLS